MIESVVTMSADQIREAPKAAPAPPKRRQFRNWLRRSIRPFYWLRVSFRFVASPFDAEDVVYLGATGLIVAGVRIISGDGYALIACGGFIIFPPLLSILRGSGPPKKRSGDK